MISFTVEAQRAQRLNYSGKQKYHFLSVLGVSSKAPQGGMQARAVEKYLIKQLSKSLGKGFQDAYSI